MTYSGTPGEDLPPGVPEYSVGWTHYEDGVFVAGEPAGAWVGEGLRHLLARVLEEPALNEPGALAAEARRWLDARRTPHLR